MTVQKDEGGKPDRDRIRVNGPARNGGLLPEYLSGTRRRTAEKKFGFMELVELAFL